MAGFYQLFGICFAILSTQATSSPDLTPIYAAIVAGIAGILGSILGKLPELMNTFARPKGDFTTYPFLPILQIRRKFLNYSEWNSLFNVKRYSYRKNNIYTIVGFIGSLITLLVTAATFIPAGTPFFGIIQQNLILISIIMSIVTLIASFALSTNYLNNWIKNRIGKGNDFLPLKFTEAYLLVACDTEKLVGNVLRALKYMKLEEIELFFDEQNRWSLDVYVKEKNHYKYILRINILSQQGTRQEIYINFLEFSKIADWRTYIDGSETMNRLISLAVLDLNQPQKSEATDKQLPKKGQ